MVTPEETEEGGEGAPAAKVEGLPGYASKMQAEVSELKADVKAMRSEMQALMAQLSSA